jgi:hypothetical protein
MADYRLARGVLGVALFVTLAPGCLTLHLYRPVVFLVRDAETKQPIAAAQLHISYPLVRPSAVPQESNGTTDNQGVARLRAIPVGDASPWVEVTANGYLSEGLSLAADAVRAIPPTWLLGTGNQGRGPFVVEMYAEPRFQIELVLPDGFRGLVKAKVQLQDNIPAPPRQRFYSYTVAPTGDVVVQGPTLLRRVFAPDYRARFADGTLLDPQPAPTEIGLRPLKREDNVEYFVVGNQCDRDQLAPTPTPTSSENHARGGGKGGGRGARRGRSGQSSSQDGSSGGS